MAYSPLKTVTKAAPPLILVIIVRAAIAAAQAGGVQIDETLAWTIAAGGYSAVIAFMNWLKNRKKKDS